MSIWNTARLATLNGSRMPISHWLLAFAAVFVWGTNFVVIAWGLAELPPFLFCTLRFLLTALPWIFFVRRPAVAWTRLMGFGMLLGAGQFGLLYFAMHRYISPGLASLLMQTQVIFTILLSLTLRKQTIRTLQILALAVAIGGIAIVIWRSATNSGGSVTPIGVLLVLAAALCWALANLVVQSVGKVNVIAFLIWSSVFAVPPLILMTALMDGTSLALHSLAAAGPRAWIAVGYQVFGNTLFGFAVWNWLLARHPAATVTPVALLVPVFGMTTAAWLLAEPLPAWKLSAAALVLSGLALNAYATRPRHRVTST
jgi:O-acetylserine/cysteine efflux transporter